MRRRTLFGLAAAGAFTPWLARAQSLPPAAEPVSALNDGLTAAMKAGKTQSFPTRFNALNPVVEQSFDLAGILRACVGPRWTSLTPSDQSQLRAVFGHFTTASYVANFASYNGQTFIIDPTPRAVGTDQVIGTRLVSQNGKELAKIDYLVRQEAGSWKIVDVLLDGTISRVAVQRSDFRSLLSDAGAGALIASLQKKIVDLSGGTLSS